MWAYFCGGDKVKLTTLEYFVAVATEKSFTRAAEKLYISQPTLSRRISELEEELGTALFVRQSHSLELTADGEKFLIATTDILKRFNHLEHLFDDKKKDGSLIVIKIGYLGNFNMGRMYSILNKFKLSHPNVQFMLKQDIPTNLLNGIRDNKYDLVFSLSSYFLNDDQFKKSKFMDNHLKIALPIDHPLKYHEKLDFADLSQETFILLERQMSPVIVDYVINQGLQNGFNLKANYYVTNLDEGLSMTSTGKGLAFLYSGMDDGTLEEKYNIKIVDLSVKHQNQDLVCVIRRDNRNKLIWSLYDELRSEEKRL